MTTYGLLAMSLVGLSGVRLARRHPVIEFIASVVTVAPLLGLLVIGVVA